MKLSISKRINELEDALKKIINAKDLYESACIAREVLGIPETSEEQSSRLQKEMERIKKALEEVGKKPWPQPPRRIGGSFPCYKCGNLIIAGQTCPCTYIDWDKYPYERPNQPYRQPPIWCGPHKGGEPTVTYLSGTKCNPFINFVSGIAPTPQIQEGSCSSPFASYPFGTFGT